MTAVPNYAAVEVGDVLLEQSYPVTRLDLVKYAGASGDFNDIHWNERVAREVGLPDVIAHGALTMALVGRAVTTWLGDPGRLVEFGVRFTKPVVVPDDGTGATLVVTAKVGAKLDDGQVRLDLTATSDEVRVLGQARAVVRLDA